MRQLCRYSKQKAIRTRMIETKLEEEIAKSEEIFISSGLESDANQLDALKDELEDLQRPLIDGFITRSRVSWHEKGERISRYFLSLEKRNACRKSVQYIQDGDKLITKN